MKRYVKQKVSYGNGKIYYPRVVDPKTQQVIIMDHVPCNTASMAEAVAKATDFEELKAKLMDGPNDQRPE